jgi:hypothetical protein
MNAIYFIEREGIRYYKCDTFWSKSKKIENAKIHTDSEHDQERFLKSLLYPLENRKEDVNPIENLIKQFQDTKYGYQTFTNSEISGLSLKESAKVSEPIYLKYITNIKKDSYDIIDYKQILRDEKIDKIMEK